MINLPIPNKAREVLKALSSFDRLDLDQMLGTVAGLFGKEHILTLLWLYDREKQVYLLYRTHSVHEINKEALHTVQKKPVGKKEIEGIGNRICMFSELPKDFLQKLVTLTNLVSERKLCYHSLILQDEEDNTKYCVQTITSRRLSSVNYELFGYLIHGLSTSIDQEYTSVMSLL